MSRDTILVVDDSRLLQMSMDLILKPYKKKGMSVEFASDGNQALERMVRDDTIGLVLLDLNMPSMSGWEFLAESRKKKLLEHIPVIIVSVEGDEGQRKRGIEEGAAAFLTKPFEFDALHKEISAALGQE